LERRNGARRRRVLCQILIKGSDEIKHQTSLVLPQFLMRKEIRRRRSGKGMTKMKM
jgi:hypothetical protein